MKSAPSRLAHIFYQGPDNTRATRLTVSISDQDGLQDLRKWDVSEGDIRQDPRITAELEQYLAEQEVGKTESIGKIFGCPHEPGEDYPMGRNCPHCPYWADRDIETHKLIQPAPPLMGVLQVIEDLSSVGGGQPIAALDSADAWRAPLTEQLLEAMDRCLNQPAGVSDEEAILFGHACYLLAKWREPRAFPRMLRWVALPAADSRALTGELLGDAGDRLLASVFNGDLESLWALITDPRASVVARVAALGAVGLLGIWGELPLEQVDAFLLRLAREGLERQRSPVWDELVKQCLTLGAVTVFDEVRRGIAEELVEPVESLPELLDAAQTMDRTWLLRIERDRRPPIDDVTEETSWWPCWNRKPPSPDTPSWSTSPDPGIPVVRETAKVGRNDPCPCGSGKKYKKCCGG